MPSLTNVITSGASSMPATATPPTLNDILSKLAAATGAAPAVSPTVQATAPAAAPTPAPLPPVKGQGVRDLSIGLMGKENELFAFKLAVLTKSHMLLLGSPGTAKSLFASQVFGQLPGIQFHTQLNKVDTGESVFGVPNVKALREEGRFEYGTEGTLLGADWAFLDEIFDASDMLMRRLLGVLNERKLALGPFAVTVPLHTAIATANYSRENEVTAAVLDRFIVKVTAKPVDNAKLIKWSLSGGQAKFTPAHVTLEALERDLKLTEAVKLPAEVGALLGQVATELNLTNRTTLATIKLVQASAYLNNRATATPEDVEAVKYTKVDESGDIAAMINVAVSKIANERNETELLNRLEGHFSTVMNMSINGPQALEAAKAIRDILVGLGSASFSDASRAKRRDSMVSELGRRKTEIARNLGFD